MPRFGVRRTTVNDVGSVVFVLYTEAGCKVYSDVT